MNAKTTSQTDCCATSSCGQGADTAAPAASVSTTMLHVPDMCCAGEYRLLEAQLKQLAGVRDVAPNYARRLVRVRHGGLSDAAVLDAAKASGFAVGLAASAPLSPTAS